MTEYLADGVEELVELRMPWAKHKATPRRVVPPARPRTRPTTLEREKVTRGEKTFTTSYHHLGPSGRPRNTHSMTREKLQHLAAHPKSTPELRRMVSRELRQRGHYVPRLREAAFIEAWSPMTERWHDQPYMGPDDWDPKMRREYDAVIRHHRRQAKHHENQARKAESIDRFNHHMARAELHRGRAKMASRDVRHAQHLRIPGAHHVTEAQLEEAFLEGYRADLLEARGSRGGASEAEMRAKASSYPAHGGGIGSSKREDIGRGKGRKYPPGFQHLRNALIRQGKSVAVASMIAYGALRRWAEGRGKVKPGTRDKARKVLGQLATRT